MKHLRIFLFGLLLSVSIVDPVQAQPTTAKASKSHPPFTRVTHHHMDRAKPANVLQRNVRTSGGCNNCIRLLASWYSLHSKMANGRRMNPGHFTVAHRTLPLGTSVRISYRGRSVLAKVTDRGPFHGRRDLDVSRAIAVALGFVGKGTAYLSLEVLA